MEKITYSIEKLAPGLCFTMGKDGTWWQVLEVNTKKKTVLVIADECICNRSYNEEWEDITWEECTLRQWLNGEYFEKTFSDKEKEAIIECKIKTPKNAKYKTKGGADTKDKIWLLSIDELNKYFKVIKNSNTGSWWLRSPGSDQKCASYAFSDVVIRNEGNCVYIEWGVRPAFLLNLNSSFFKQMFEDEDSLKIKVPELYIQDCILERVRPGIKNVQIPEGVTEIHENCFAYMNKLKEVKFPTTLKKIGNEAFVGCASLESVAGTNGSITYGKCVFSSCKKLNYTAEMFHNTGKLSDSFKSHMENCGPAELAWIIMYQKSIDWEDALSKKITKDNANKILEVMKEHIAAAKKLPKKEATAATSFVTANILLFSSDEVRSFCDMLTDKKLAGLAESIQSDPSVMNVLGTSDSRAAESGLSGKLSGSVSQIVMPDGSILYGEMESCIEPGCRFPMGNAGTKWRILSIDQEEKTAVVIADKPICNRSYNEKVEDITWEQCTLRQWLNGKYFEETFSDQEKEAIIECEIKTPDNIKYGTEGGADTKDRIWLLSIDEAIQYFADDEDRITRAFWWLRSPGWYQDYAAGVYVDGSVYVIGSYFSNEDGVRPAFLL